MRPRGHGGTKRFSTGASAAAVGPDGLVCAIDISDSMLALARARTTRPGSAPIELRKAGAERLPYPEASFDVAVSTQVLEYVQDVPGALAEIHRVLRPGGRALLLDTDWDSIMTRRGDCRGQAAEVSAAPPPSTIHNRCGWPPTVTASCDTPAMRRASKFPLRPTSKQTGALTAMLDEHRQLDNGALEHRRTAWRMRNVTVRYGDQSAELKDIRWADPAGQGRWSCSCQQATLRRLDRAFQAFFRRIKHGQTPGYPRFKGRGWFDTVTWPADGDGCRWHPDQRRVDLQGVGQVKVHAYRPVQGRVKTLSVKREGKRWFLILSCAEVPAVPLPPTGAVVGLDLGVAWLVTTSDGKQIANPRWLAASAERLTRAQQALARKQRGSKRRGKAKARVAALHGKIRRQRRDHAHKTALGLVRGYDLLVHEALQIGNMTRSASGSVERPGTNVAQKAGLNRSLLDVGWGVFLSILADKAASAGRTIIAVDPRNTSCTCPACGQVAAGNRPSQAKFRCVACGHSAHADVNAASNILRAGLALQAARAA